MKWFKLISLIVVLVWLAVCAVVIAVEVVGGSRVQAGRRAADGGAIVTVAGEENGLIVSVSPEEAPATPAPAVASAFPRMFTVELPAGGQWVETDLVLNEPGLCYPVTGEPPPGLFDFDVAPRRLGPSGHPDPGAFLRAGGCAYIRPTKPGRFMYRLLERGRTSGTWTFTVGRGVPISQISFDYYENTPRRLVAKNDGWRRNN